MDQNTLDGIVKDVLRAALMLVIMNTVTLLTAFGFDLSIEQVAALKAFFDSATILGFLVARLLKVLHDSKPAQVQVVNAEGQDVALIEPPARATRSSRRQSGDGKDGTTSS